jgi:hypothetical protein
MAINSYGRKPQVDTLSRVAQALQIAQSAFGIPVAWEQFQSLKQDQSAKEATAARQAKLDDPNSAESHAAQESTKGLVGELTKSGSLSGDSANKLSGYIGGQDLQGPVQPGQSPLKTPGLSASYLQNFNEMNPQVKLAIEREKGKAAATRLNIMDSARTEKNEIAVNKDYQKNLGPYESTIQAANRAQHIIEQIRNGELKSTPTLRNDLNAAVGSMFNNGKGATVYSMSHSDQDSLFANIKQKVGYLSGQAVDTLPEGQLEQLNKDIDSLKSSYLDAHDVAYQSWREGVPDRVREKLDSRFNKFREMASGKAPAEQTGGSGLPLMESASASQSPMMNGLNRRGDPQDKQVAPGVTTNDIQAELARRNAAKAASKGK